MVSLSTAAEAYDFRRGTNANGQRGGPGIPRINPISRIELNLGRVAKGIPSATLGTAPIANVCCVAHVDGRVS